MDLARAVHNRLLDAQNKTFTTFGCIIYRNLMKER